MNKFVTIQNRLLNNAVLYNKQISNALPFSFLSERNQNMFRLATRTTTSIPLKFQPTTITYTTPKTKPIISTLFKMSASTTSSSLPKSGQAPGEQFEVRQTSSTEDWHPTPSKSLPLSKARQELLDDIIALYSCQPTVERVKRYTPDCVYDDQFVYANDR